MRAWSRRRRPAGSSPAAGDGGAVPTAAPAQLELEHRRHDAEALRRGRARARPRSKLSCDEAHLRRARSRPPAGTARGARGRARAAARPARRRSARRSRSARARGPTRGRRRGRPPPRRSRRADRRRGGRRTSVAAVAHGARRAAACRAAAPRRGTPRSRPRRPRRRRRRRAAGWSRPGSTPHGGAATKRRPRGRAGPVAPCGHFARSKSMPTSSVVSSRNDVSTRSWPRVRVEREACRRDGRRRAGRWARRPCSRRRRRGSRRSPSRARPGRPRAPPLPVASRRTVDTSFGRSGSARSSSTTCCFPDSAVT